MKRLFLAYFVYVFIFVTIAYSALVEVDIAESLDGNIVSLLYDNSSNVVKFTTEFYNTGSIGYKTRLKFEIFEGNKMVFSSWSKEQTMMPGDKHVFENYWYGKKDVYYMKLKVYLGNEIKQYKKFEVSINRDIDSESVFKIRNFRTYDDFMIFDVQTDRDVENVVVMPSKYRYGWIIEQENIDFIKGNTSKTVKIKYYPTVWSPSDIKMVVVSDEGKYFSEQSLVMEKHEGLTGLFYLFIDNFRSWLL